MNTSFSQLYYLLFMYDKIDLASCLYNFDIKSKACKWILAWPFLIYVFNFTTKN